MIADIIFELVKVAIIALGGYALWRCGTDYGVAKERQRQLDEEAEKRRQQINAGIDAFMARTAQRQNARFQ